ncbi:MAG: hypothetical protein JZU65_21690, partial [Chlorobium sp.]|nr:hypothetical protein [Chlorobium sp.]
MNDNHNLNRFQLLEKLKSIRPVVIDTTMTFNVGIDCTIATNEGIIYPEPDMFGFSAGSWPVTKLYPSD